MERFAFISDVHSNLEALEITLKALRDCRVYCLGDIVDYGANPNEVVELLKKASVTAIRGNHDEAVLTRDVSMFNAKAAISLNWTADRLTRASKDYLAPLPLETRTELGGATTYLTHGSPDDNLWEYVDPSTHHALFGHYLGKLGVRLIGLGHTHKPYVWEEGHGIVFNPGSVGQPRDGDPRSSHALVTVEEGRVEVVIHRLEYDVDAAASKIIDAGLPEFLAERLYRGL